MSDIYTILTDETEEDLSGILSSSRQPLTAGAAPGDSSEGLPPRLAALVRAIEPPAVREFMRRLFADIAKLLARLGRVTDAAGQDGELGGLRRVLDALNKSSRYLLTNLETAELRVDGLPAPLAEALEAAAFALGHELRRVFETELAGAGGTQAPPPQGALRACALLENCFQQLTISLARAFDEDMTGAALFENYRARREQSLTLRGELKSLLSHVRTVEGEFGVLSSLALLSRVRRFRYEYLHHLMYGDWEDFERFADALELSHESEGEMAVLLNRLSCYVEALLSQVGMRAVLADERDPAPAGLGTPAPF